MEIDMKPEWRVSCVLAHCTCTSGRIQLIVFHTNRGSVTLETVDLESKLAHAPVSDHRLLRWRTERHHRVCCLLSARQRLRRLQLHHGEPLSVRHRYTCFEDVLLVRLCFSVSCVSLPLVPIYGPSCSPVIMSSVSPSRVSWLCSRCVELVLSIYSLFCLMSCRLVKRHLCASGP